MSPKYEYKGPLSGLNVIDFGHYYAGPMAAMLLADQGANVVRVVKPGEPELPCQQYRLLNRNKKLLELDLKTEEGKTQALSLLERADVVIENFRPGVMKRLSLDYPSVKYKNPGLVYLSLPGFASTDKERSHIQAWEGVLDAAAGTYYHISTFRAQLNYPPVYTSAPHCSIYGAMHGAIAVIAALLAREKCGHGTIIEAPQVECGLSGFIWSSVGNQQSSVLAGALTAFDLSPEDSPAKQEEKLNQAARKARSLFGGAFGNFYPCADGRMIYIWVPYYAKLSEKLLKALGIDKSLKQEGFVNEGPWVTGLDNNPSSFNELSPEHQRRLEKLITEVFLSKTSAEWDLILKQEGVAATVFRTRGEWLALKPMLKSGVLAQLDNGRSTLTVPGRLADISMPANGKSGDSYDSYRDAEPLTYAQAFTLFAPTTSSEKLPLDEEHPLKKSDLLKGLKVLDLTNVLAGPTAGHVLAQFGAQVVKADSASFQDPPLILGALLEHNQGKRSILTDVTTAPGREVFQQLISHSDVVIHNILDDTAYRLGVTQEQLGRINPNVVSAQLSAFGGTRRGGWEMRPGFDPVAQCATGLPAQYGTLEEPHLHNMALSGDTMGGFSLAFTALLGVYQQHKTGHAAEGRTSLVRAINHYQLPWMIAENGHSDWGEARGQLALGEHSWQRMYACRDGWIFVDTRKARSAVLVETILGHQNVDAPMLESILETAFAKDDCADWQTRLEAAGIACHPVQNLDRIYTAMAVRPVSNEEADEIATGTSERLCREQHPCGSPVYSKAPDHVRIGENHSYKRLSPAPRLGEHTREILQELGYSQEAIKELIRLKVSHEYLPAMGSRASYFYRPEKQYEK